MFYPVKMVSFSPDNKQLLIKAGIGVGLFFLGKHLYENWQKSQGEAKIDTPAGQIAVQLKNIFETFPVDDAAYRRVMQQVNSDNEKDVRDIYREITGGRFLSDDEAKHITNATQETAAKQYKINNTPGTLISIINDEIRFNVGRGSLIRFAPGQTTPISLYLQPEDIAEGTAPAVSMPPNSKYWKVTDTRLVPIDGITLRKDWKLVFAPFLPWYSVARTHKEYAAVQIDISGGKGETLVWANATDFRTQSFSKGMGEIEQGKKVIAKETIQVFNEAWKQTGFATKGMILGKLLLVLDTKNLKYAKVETAQGLIRWVSYDKVIIKT